MIGPRTRDIDFFSQAVDTSLPGLEGIEEALAAGDLPSARTIFARYARETLKPELYFQVPPQDVRHSFFLPGESEAEAAERILQLHLISTGTPHRFEGDVDWFANPTFNQYKEWTWQLSRHHDWEVLANRYRATGDERYAEAFVRMLLSWVRQAVVPESAPGSDTLCWRTIESGIRMSQSWPLALHSFYNSPHFMDDVLMEWYKSVWEHGVRLRHFHRHGNWLIMEMNGLVHIGILYPMFKDAAAWKRYGLERLAEELDMQMYPDGFQYELSTSYHQVVLTNYYRLSGLCSVYGERTGEEFNRRLEEAYSIPLKLMMPDGRQPDLNDGSWAEVAELMKPAVKLFPERKDFLWAATDRREGETPREASVGLPYAGYYIMRSGWSRDAVWGLFDAGPFGRGHQHEDKLNLLIHAYGELLVTEGGNYAYDSSEMRRYVLSTRAHNTIRVDGYDQNRRWNYAWNDAEIQKPCGAKWHTELAFDAAEGIYDEGYGPNGEISVIHRRKVMFLKEFSPLAPCFLVIDRLYPEDELTRHFDILWHLSSRSLEVDGLTVSSRNKNAANITILSSESAEPGVDIVNGRRFPEWQGWATAAEGLQGDYQAMPTAIYHFSAKGPVRLATLLYPTRPGQSCGVVRMDASADVENRLVELTFGDGTKLQIQEADFPA